MPDFVTSAGSSPCADATRFCTLTTDMSGSVLCLNDLIRWGIVENTLKEHEKPYASNFVSTKHTLLPIPHNEFLMNTDWEQNPGYSK